MHVVDHKPHAWFLFREENALLLDVNCNHGPAGYCVIIQLNEEEEIQYHFRGHAYIDWLAQAVQDSGPGSSYQRRSLPAYSEKSSAAVNEWRAAQKRNQQREL